MAIKKTKKTPAIKLQSFDDVDFNKAPDLQAAQKVITPQFKRELSDFTTRPIEQVEQKPAQQEQPAVVPVTRMSTSVPATPAKKVVSSRSKKAVAPGKGTFPPTDKKRASFNIDADLHRALKEYSFFEEIEMVEYIFEHLVRPDLAKKGYYPPKKRRR